MTGQPGTPLPVRDDLVQAVLRRMAGSHSRKPRSGFGDAAMAALVKRITPQREKHDAERPPGWGRADPPPSGRRAIREWLNLVDEAGIDPL